MFIGCSIINHRFWGTPIFGNPHLDTHIVSLCFRLHLQIRYIKTNEAFRLHILHIYIYIIYIYTYRETHTIILYISSIYIYIYIYIQCMKICSHLWLSLGRSSSGGETGAVCESSISVCQFFEWSETSYLEIHICSSKG